MNHQRIFLYDTTLRDGAQSEGISFSVEDKLNIAYRLDAIGFDYIEGGWPGSNPKDMRFFEIAAQQSWQHAKIAAFGSTCRVDAPAHEDKNLLALLQAKTPVVTIFGKTWDLHVFESLRTSLEKNLELIRESVRFLKEHGKEVIYDAEHFFDGYCANAEYALETLRVAHSAGADALVLCDTNGGTLTSKLRQIVREVHRTLADVPLGIHAHNDAELATANSLSAAEEGAVHVQGTINGYGERCGNANLCAVIPNLTLKMGKHFSPHFRLQDLTDLSRFVSETANMPHPEKMAYVGHSAFAHKGGIHVSAILRNSRTYEHIDPSLVGNRQRVLVSDQSGGSNILYKAQNMGLDLSSNKEEVRRIVQELKELEHLGYQFEGAEGSFEILVKRTLGTYQPFFTLLSARVSVDKSENGTLNAEAVVKIRVGDKLEHTAAEGHGPVDALDKALRKALMPFYPAIAEIKLVDYKVRVLNSEAATAAKVRVHIQSSDSHESWGTVGVSENIIEASWQALVDSISYKLLKIGKNGNR